MSILVANFKELTPELQLYAGGKGSMLAKMFQSGYPVPEGFVLLTSAFENGTLSPDAWVMTRTYLEKIKSRHDDALFAVRSSSLSEDSARASFAGEFESVLNRKTDEEIFAAIETVLHSKASERVKAYSLVQGIEEQHNMAVVVQLMVQSNISGVLFTADPITGSRTNMVGNYVYGLGEQLVSGEANAHSFRLARPNGYYEGPEQLGKNAQYLYKYADRLERDFGFPQDIEWAVSKGELYILQSRPITTLQDGNFDTYEINESLTGDFLWVNTNIGEAIPDVMTPLTWTILRVLDNEISTVPGYYLWSGNICGRAYTNINMRLSIWNAFGISAKRGMSLLKDVLGDVPEEMRIPIYPFSRFGLLKTVLPRVGRYFGKMLKAFRNINHYLEENPIWCKRMTEQIQKLKTKEELLALWTSELYPYNREAWFSLISGAGKAALVLRLGKELLNLVGTENANVLLSNLRGKAGLASLEPVLGIAKVIKGEISHEEYLMLYGHRGPHEFELSIPHPAVDANWLEKQIEQFKKSNTDVENLLKKQQSRYEQVLDHFCSQFPDKARKIEKKLAAAAEAARLREAVRSEFVRVFRVCRAFALQVGELFGIGEDIFYLYLSEVIQLLSNDSSALQHIPARKETYNKLKTLPPFPSVIRGRFDPYQWATDPNRRLDYYDANATITDQESEMLTGFAGAAGRVEGVVRVLANPEEGELLQAGEILVASTTNVGWTPLFPRAAAIITDIGAPLSHAAIVARELGIPAVVGCGNATTRLKTGDQVIVNGGQGVVQILNK